MNRYINRVEIYAGPTSIVCKAECTSNSKLVALKEVDLDLCRKPHNARAEIKLLKKLRNPYILPLLDSFAYNDSIVLVTPYYKFDLDQWIKKCIKKKMKFDLSNPMQNKMIEENRFPLSEVKNIILKLAQALEYLHEGCGIIHRDVKPSNIYFSDENSDPILGDFGISYDTSSPPSDEPPQEKYTDVSSGIFKAPEICFGFRNYGYPMDMWSLGVIISILYSSSGHSFLDNGDAFSELGYIHAVFCNLGTPSISDASNQATYWPEAASPESHFTQFNFEIVPRKPITRLLPRCDDDTILQIFDALMVYSPSRRLTAHNLVTCIVPTL